jgi:hypothetical protein
MLLREIIGLALIVVLTECRGGSTGSDTRTAVTDSASATDSNARETATPANAESTEDLQYATIRPEFGVVDYYLQLPPESYSTPASGLTREQKLAKISYRDEPNGYLEIENPAPGDENGATGGTIQIVLYKQTIGSPTVVVNQNRPDGIHVRVFRLANNRIKEEEFPFPNRAAIQRNVNKIAGETTTPANMGNMYLKLPRVGTKAVYFFEGYKDDLPVGFVTFNAQTGVFKFETPN